MVNIWAKKVLEISDLKYAKMSDNLNEAGLLKNASRFWLSIFRSTTTSESIKHLFTITHWVLSLTGKISVPGPSEGFVYF